jgi:dUTP pyrophosphatase
MLNSKEIRKLIENQQLITGYIDLQKQIQPSGFDLSLGEVHTLSGDGSVDFSNRERRISPTTPINPGIDGWYKLRTGCYLVVYNEVVRIPLYLSAIARTRSTLLRNGAVVETAVWDPGYQGKSSSLLTVHNPSGINLKKNARIAQLIFFMINEIDVGYNGVYQHERLVKDES